MNPTIIAAAVTAAENLIGFILEAKANGAATDAQLDSMIKTTNAATRTAIQNALQITPPTVG